MDPVYFILQQIRKRPALYLGKKSLVYLAYFIDGYQFRAAADLWTSTTNFDFIENYEVFIHSSIPYRDCLSRFGSFVHRHFNDTTTGSWERVISENSSSQEEAFDKFYELLDIHVEQQRKEKME